MSVVLPQELMWVLDAINIQWPNIDEDAIKEVADECRQIGSDLKSGHGDAKAEIEQMLNLNSSEALTVFQALWSKLSDGHMQDFVDALDALADVLDVVFGIIVAMKLEAIVQLGILAAQLIFDQAAAIETLGLSEAEAATAMTIGKALLRRIFDEALHQIEHELLMAVAGPLLKSLESAGANLATQLLGDAVGVGHGIDLSQLESAGKSGFGQGLSTLESQGSGLLSNPLGAAVSLANGTGLPGGSGTQMSTDALKSGDGSGESSGSHIASVLGGKG